MLVFENCESKIFCTSCHCLLKKTQNFGKGYQNGFFEIPCVGTAVPPATAPPPTRTHT